MRILESAIYVEDVARAAAFYERLFGFPRLVYDAARFCALDVSGEQVFLIFKKGVTRDPLPLPDGQVIPPHHGEGQLHFAFGVEKEELPAWERRLADAGCAIESRLRWPLGGESVYFRDCDNHLVEIATRGVWRTY